MKLSFLFLSLLVGCSHQRLMPFTQSGAVRYPAKPASAVEVYRSVIPFDSFEEMGLITVNVPTNDLGRIYEDLRLGAAEMSADAVVGVKIDVHVRDRAATKEVCVARPACVPQASCATADGSCTTETICVSTPVCSTVVEPANTATYLGMGTMIRRKP